MLEILPLLIPVGYLAFVSFQLARIDVREHRLPNSFTLRLFALTAPATALTFVLAQSLERLLWALGIGFGTALIGLFLGLTGGMGLGDVKLMTSLNLILGWFSPWVALASNGLAVLSAALIGILNLAKGDRIGKRQIAFGPYLLGSFFACFGYSLIVQLY